MAADRGHKDDNGDGDKDNGANDVNNRDKDEDDDVDNEDNRDNGEDNREQETADCLQGATVGMLPSGLNY
ncbi:hypothetical protein CGMCC3_g11569 [Colletotrichum fructicola]|nr:uncharacterized protein CGMCC3_g11569 [Colletotrichum fructicola]KAE9572200.1 hypothetical protein CGMCC3_g11569 [Colletotrichum fructicola]